MTTAITGTYLIENRRIEEIGAKLKRLSKIAVKLGLSEFEIRVGDPVFKKVRLTNSDGVSSTEKIMFREVTFTGQQPILGDWQFQAKLEHTESGNIVQRARFGGEADEPLDGKYRTCPPNCDHCNTNRDRNYTYLFKHRVEGTIKQVGSSCFKDFDGHGDPNALLAYLDGVVELQDWADQFDDDEDLGFAGSRGDAYYDIGDVLATAIAVIRREGSYIGTSMDDLETPTRDTVAMMLSPGKGQRETAETIINADDREKAELILEWMQAFPADCSDYEHNLKTIGQLGAVARKHLGYAVSAVPSWERSQMELGAAAEQTSTHIGTKGDKWVERKVVFNKSPSFSSNWGTTYNVLMTDVETGGKLLWKTGSPLPFLSGQEYAISCTVKGHSEYQDIKQTEVTRVGCPSLNLVNLTKHIQDKDTSTILKLIRKVADVNAVSSDNMTALQNVVEYANACVYENADDETWKPLVKALLDAGADPLKDNRGGHPIRTALDSALVYVETNDELSRMLLDHLVAKGQDMGQIQSVLTNPDFSFYIYSDDEKRSAHAARSILQEYGAPYSPPSASEEVDDVLELNVAPAKVVEPVAAAVAASSPATESKPAQDPTPWVEAAPALTGENAPAGETGDLFGFDQNYQEEEVEPSPRHMRMG